MQYIFKGILNVALILSSIIALLTWPAAAETAQIGKVTSFSLDNGLQVVVIEDHRVPVITQMVWYKMGAVDDPAGKSGLAHLLEHLMFKSCSALSNSQDETFASKISALGAIDNATTDHDWTYYYQRATKDKLRELMQIEAARMNKLSACNKQVFTERDVVLAERRSNVESDVIKLLSEQMSASLYNNHGYGRPTIGWAHEIVKLTPKDAFNAYETHYKPANAVLVIAGDVSPEEIRPLAEDIYGPIAKGPQVVRVDIEEPEPIAARRVILSDPRAKQRALFRSYLAPSYKSSAKEAVALQVLARILGSGGASRLHQSLVIEDQDAIAAGAQYLGEKRDSGQFVVFAITTEVENFDEIEHKLDRAIANIAENGVTEDELARAKSAIEANLVIESDNQLKLATRYGQAIAIGRTIEGIASLPGQIRNVTPADVQAVAIKFLRPERSVTGQLRPPPKS